MDKSEARNYFIIQQRLMDNVRKSNCVQITTAPYQ